MTMGYAERHKLLKSYAEYGFIGSCILDVAVFFMNRQESESIHLWCGGKCVFYTGNRKIDKEAA